MQKLRIFWYKFRAKAVSSIVNLFASQSNYDINNTILLIGSARSGTTFLTESLNHKNEYRIIFEPFNPTYTKEWNSYSARHYIDPKTISDVTKQAVDKILCGRIKNSWIDRYNRKLRSDKRLIKSVRANLLLDYLESEYPALKIIYLYRNPYDVVESRIKLNFDPKDYYLVLKHEEFRKRYYHDIDVLALNRLLKTPESCHTALWCFENRFILRSLDKRQILKVRYEDIIGKTIQMDNEKLIVTNEIRRPSVTSSLRKSYQLSETEIYNVNEILSFFGMTAFLRK